jgi:flavorubredoxin
VSNRTGGEYPIARALIIAYNHAYRSKERSMNPRKICAGVHWVGFVDWNRRLFDSLVPLPDGTSYNAYLVSGSEKTALADKIRDKHAKL